MFGGELAAVVFGLASALSWGAGDFSGGLASKRAPVFGVMLFGHAAGLVLLLGLALLWYEPLPPVADLGWGFAAGFSGAIGSAALPVLFGALVEGLPGALKLAGFGLAIVGGWLIAGTGGKAGGRAGLALALLAGGGFGGFFILIHRAGATATFWPLAAARLASLLFVAAVLLRRRQDTPRRALPLALLSGVLDVGGNAFFVLAGQAGRLDVAAILASMYPATTVLLAGLLLGERVTRAQAAGIAVVLAAIALIAA
jgi:drug/metabolite transporter (DMT)-like permease